MGSGTVPVLVAAHLVQCADLAGGPLPPLRPSKPGRAHVSASRYVRHGAGRGGRLAASHGGERAERR